MKKQILLLFLYVVCTSGKAQYAPAAGQTGSTAMSKDSSAFINWANACHVQRGLQDISTPSLGLATSGDSSMAAGKADLSALSLGDGGSAVCTFMFPIVNGPGADFAVFENSFSDTFLELAFVEVSSDGINYTRFTAHSLSDTSQQTGPFGFTDPTKLNNLAGKYRGGFGTPFDLQELAGKPGLDIQHITHVRITDVVGNLNKAYATYDGYGNKINDPWPTAFPSGGFDLDAIGVIHQNAPLAIHLYSKSNLGFFPNPVSRGGTLQINGDGITRVEVLDQNGTCKKLVLDARQLNLEELPSGIYQLRTTSQAGTETKKLIIE